MSYQPETPFDNIEGSHEYVALLAEAVDEARRDVEAELAVAERDGADRRKEALLLVSYNLAKLNLHITTSRRILNDLRMLRRLLLAERGLPTAEPEICRPYGRIKRAPPRHRTVWNYTAPAQGVQSFSSFSNFRLPVFRAIERLNALHHENPRQLRVFTPLLLDRIAARRTDSRVVPQHRKNT